MFCNRLVGVNFRRRIIQGWFAYLKRNGLM